MNWTPSRFDWNQARAFLVTAEEGSLSAAAKALGLTQPTLSRQVAALETTLGVTLFERVGRSLTLTETGIDMLDQFRAMGEAAGRISLSAAGQSQTVEGLVRLTSTNDVASFHLPAMLKHLREAAQGIEIELVTSNETRDLLRREADIAVRHARPEQPDLIAKLVAETTAHVYASTKFLETYGRPRTLNDLADLNFIGFETAETMLPMFQSLGMPVTRQNFMISTESGTAIRAFMQHGLGIGIMTKDLEPHYPELERVLPELIPALPVPVWLVTHRELFTSRRIRIVFDLLAEEFQKMSTDINP